MRPVDNHRGPTQKELSFGFYLPSNQNEEAQSPNRRLSTIHVSQAPVGPSLSFFDRNLFLPGPAPSYKSVAFPIQREAIKARYRESQRKLATERKAEAKSKTKQLALELNAAGVYPALTKIAQTYKGKIGMPGAEIAAVLREFRQENGIKYSRSD
jgi:hypothetical protein